MSEGLIRGSVCTVGALLLSGCAVEGAPFEKPMPAPQDGAMAYFYRPPELQGSALTLQVMDQSKDITTLKNGQFSAVPLSVGHHDLGTSRTKSVSLDAVAGETYYFRFVIQHGVVANTMVFARVYPDDAIAELRQCCKDGSDLTHLMQ